RTAPTFAVIAKAVVRTALWFCASNLLAAVLAAQCTNVSQVPNQTISSGTPCYSNNNTLTASEVIIYGSASVSFVAGQSIHLQPGFQATAGTAGTTFHAWVETVPTADSVSPSSGSGLSQAFTWKASSPSGYTNLLEMQALFNTSVSGLKACYILYNRASNLLYLADNSGSNWSSGLVPGGSGTAGNSQCSIAASGSSVSAAANQLTLTVSVTFQPSFSGTKNDYLLARNNEGLTSEWQQMGSWTVGNPTGFTPIRISAGGPYTDSLGQVWAADYGYLESLGTWTTTAAITGTPDPSLYRTERYNYPGSLTYQFSVPNGNYTVTLKFAEIYDTAPGQRYMNIALNGTTVVTGLDVWTASGGPNRAYDLSFPVGVTNGQLTISLTCTSPNNSAEVNAIQIVAAGTPQQYSLTTAVSPSGAGSTAPSCPSGCLYTSGSQVQITATPAAGYQFTGFSGTVNSGSNPLTVTMNSAMTET
ncbi:MAG: malectin domain-containing carbohydrate-binding protein, partial [Planctomycetota bacterium]